MVKKTLFLAIAAMLFLAGCLVTKSDEDCSNLKAASIGDKLKVGQLPMCYHEVALGHALKGEKQSAIDSCKKIGETGVAIADNEMNNCFEEVAEAFNDTTICDEIHTTFTQNPLYMVWDYQKKDCETRAQPKNYDLGLCFIGPLMLAAPLLFSIRNAARK